jgi:general secretion pathway protein A
MAGFRVFANMYEEHFGLKSRPFGAKAEGAGVFVGPHQTKIMSSLTKGLAAADAVVTVTGPVGVGKTTIVSRALETISPGRMVAWVGRMQLAPDEVLELLLAGFGVNRQNKGTIQRFAAFRRLLAERAAAGAQVAIVVEDAHRIGIDALVEIEALTAADTGDSTSANIILMGQAGLNKMLASPELARISQRNRLRQKIDPFSDAEVTGYLKHCIRQAGGDYDTIFDSGVAEIVARCSEGVPRVINTLCETAMATAMEDGLLRVSTTLMRQVAADAFGFEATQTNVIPAIGAENLVAPDAQIADPQEFADAALIPETQAADVSNTDIPELIDDTQPELQQIDAGNEAIAEITVEATQTLKTLPMLPDDEVGADDPDAEFSLDAALSVDAEETNVMPGITPNLDELAANARKEDAAKLAPATDPTENIPTLSDSMRIDVDVEVERARKMEVKTKVPPPQEAAPIKESHVIPEPVQKPEAAPKPHPEPVAATPEPVPEPEPVAVRPEPVTKPEPVAVKPEPVTKPEPVAARHEPVAAQPEPESVREPDPQPELVAMQPAPRPNPVPVSEPVAAKPEPGPVIETIAAAPVTEAPVANESPDDNQSADAEAAADAWSGIKDDAADESESVEEIDTSAEPLTLATDNLTLTNAAKPEKSPAVMPAKRLPDIGALEAALDAAKKGDFAIQPDSAPVADFADAKPVADNEQADEAVTAVPEITLDDSLPQKNVDDDELRRVAEQIGSANSLEDVSDLMAETIFGSQALDEIAAAVVANPPQEAVSPVMLEEADVAPAANDADSNKPVTNGVATAGKPAEPDESAARRLDMVKALNTENGKTPAAKAEKIELGSEKPKPVAARPTGPQPEPIENQINTSMTQTLKALSSANVRPPVEPEEEKKSGGLFSRFRRSS